MAFKRKYRSRRFKKTRRGRYARRRGARSFQKRVRKAVLKTAETKYYDIGIENEQLYHNCGTQQVLFPGFVRSIPAWFNPWTNVGPGTGRMQRIGDKITPRGISIKMYLANKFDRVNTMIRVIVAILPKLISGSVVGTRFDPFQLANQGANGNNMLNPPDHDKNIKFLYDKIHRMSDQSKDVVGASTGKELTKVIRLWIKNKSARPIIYDQGTFDINIRPMAVYVIPYEQYSTLNTDNIATVAGYMRMYYKDV